MSELPPPLLILLGAPLLGALAALAVRPHRAVAGGLNGGLALVALTAALALWRQLLQAGPATWGPGEFLRADALSTLLAFCVSAVAALAAWLGPGMGRGGEYDAAQIRRFRTFGNLFVFTMLLAVTTNNVGVMWIAIEASTITSAVIIPLHVSKGSVEASWKYILIGSIGIALAFAGTVLAYFDFFSTAGHHQDALNWTVLMAAAPGLHPEVVQLAFVLLLIGYGTKAGLAPMHTWLPDAHAEAPSPLSALLSGVLLAVALYAVVRWEAVVYRAVGSGFTDVLYLALGLLSLGIAALSLVGQGSYKRLLAYSSIEHIGLMCVGLGLGPLGIWASMLHLLNHAVAKSLLFFLSGRLLQRYGTTEIGGVSGVARAMPATGGLFGAGVLAILGLPPFGLFVSEFALIRAGFAAGRPWVMGLVLLLLAVAFVAVVGHLHRMLHGPVPEGVRVGETERWALVPLALCLVALVVLGVTVPAPLEALLGEIVEITGR